MALYRKSEAMKEQIHELYSKGFAIKKIARALKISKNTVKVILRSGKTQKAEAETESHPPPKNSIIAQEVPIWARGINWEAVIKERRKGVTIKVLHYENAPHLSYWGFQRYLAKICPPKPRDITMCIPRVPGQTTFIDFADGINIVDRDTGTITKTHLFCAVLPFSSYTFGEFVLDQKLKTFISVQERMFQYFGGVTPQVTPDNLKSGVTKAHRYDPDENKTYCEFGNHYGFTVIPTRPRSPRDKAGVESGIGVIQRQFFNEVRHQVFYCLADLNRTFKEYLTKLNQAVMKDYGVSRNERFEMERKHLKPLPVTLYDLSEWREAKVHPDCEIQVDKNFYTVPFTYVGRKVRIRLKGNTIEVFDTNTAELITTHIRLQGIGKHSHYDSHYPPQKVQVARFDIQSAKISASQVGKNTELLVNDLFSGSWPLQGLRRAQGILNLANKYSKDAMEYACSMAIKFNKRRYAYIKECAVHYEQNGIPTLITSAPKREPGTSYLHSLIAHTGN